MSEREDWFEGQLELDPARLVFLDETWASTIMARTNAFAKIKSGLRKAAERTIDALWAKIGMLIGTITPQECANYFAAAGYDAD